MRNILIGVFATLLVVVIFGDKIGLLTGFGEAKTEREGSEVAGESYMWTSLTVAQSKRLIAMGLARYEEVSNALKSGEIIVARGSTNHYLMEEFAGVSVDHGAFLTGNIQPMGKRYTPSDIELVSDAYFKDGVMEHINLADGLSRLSKGALLFKGANMINYDKGQASLLIGHPEGGTLALMKPYIESGVAKLIIPVGLEKNSSYDLEALSADFQEKRAGALRIFMMPGELFTEIEAIRQFADVDVRQIASGGLNGAEGAVSLSVRGSEAEVAKVKALMDSLSDEPAFY